MALSAKRAAFVREYLVDLNATAAAARAGYKHPNKQGPRLLVNVGIAAAIAASEAERSARTGLTQDWVLAGLKAEAESPTGSRVKALELIGRHLGMWPNKVQVEGGIRLEIVEEIVDADSPPRSKAPPGAT